MKFLSESRHYRQTAAVPLQKSTHEGSDVPIYARGPWAHLFHSTHEQHYIFHAIAHASCTGGHDVTEHTKHCAVQPSTAAQRNSRLAETDTHIAQDYVAKPNEGQPIAYSMTSSANSFVLRNAAGRTSNFKLSYIGCLLLLCVLSCCSIRIL